VTLNLSQRMLAVNKSLGWVEKAGKNTQQNYDFVRAVDVFDDARKAFAEHGVLWMFSTRDYTISEINGKVWHQMVGDYSLTNVDKPDEVITGTVNGSACPPGDKGAWVVTTGMMKYALIQALLLPTGDDPENDENEAKPKNPASPQPAAQKATTVKAEAPQATSGLTPKQIAKLMATFGNIGITESASRKHITMKLTGKHSVKQMTGDDLDKILGFFDGKSDENQSLVIEAMAAVSA